jgi:hypothetical protein
VQAVYRAVEDNGEKLDRLEVIQAELDAQTGAMERQLRVLEDP